ncbi:helix-turn-helix transcriptional regulator, partial [Pseudonocardia sp.]|uniref:helix-turn-helix domain-containing protein n=1 Tax=Pseudonocardia sp. TaxID=60912 RepID=UPI002623CD9B
MTTDGAPGALRAARMRQGWSQSDTAREIVALARRRGEPVAAAASLKTLLSRWENGHVVPEPQYRALLAELLGCTPAELGIDPDARDVAAVTGTARLRAALAEAGAVDGTGLDLWLEQLATASRLDDELGAAGAGGLVRAQVEQLDRTLVHTLAAERRA